MKNTYTDNSETGVLFTKYPCLNLIWAFNGSDRAQKRSEYVSELLAAAGVPSDDILDLLRNRAPYLDASSSKKDDSALGRRPYDVLYSAFEVLGYSKNARSRAELQYSPCIFCENNCGTREQQQYGELYDTELILLRTIIENPIPLLPSLKNLFLGATRKKFLRVFEYRMPFYQRENQGDVSGIVSVPVFRYAVSEVLSIIKSHAKETDKINMITGLSVLDPSSVLQELMTDGRFNKVLADNQVDKSLIRKYEYGIRRAILKSLEGVSAVKVNYNDFLSASAALSVKTRGQEAFFPEEEPDGFCAVLSTSFQEYIRQLSSKPDTKSAPLSPAAETTAASGTPCGGMPSYEELRRRNQSQLEALAEKNSSRTADDLLQKGGDKSTDSCDTWQLIPDLTAGADGEPIPDSTQGEVPEPPSSSTDELSVRTFAEPVEKEVRFARSSPALFSSDGLLLLDSLKPGTFRQYSPHRSDEWFQERESYEALSVELSQLDGKTGFLFYGYPVDTLSDPLPFFISLSEADTLIKGTGSADLLFDVGHKVYYTYNKARIVSYLIDRLSIQPDTLIRNILSVQAVQCLHFKSNLLYAAELFRPYLGLSDGKAVAPDTLLKSYKEVYRIGKEKLLADKKANLGVLRNAEAFEYAIGTSLNISDYATVDGENCRRKTWTRADYEYSDFRRIRKRGIHVGFEIIPQGEKSVSIQELYFVTALCIGRCLVSQVINKSHPVLLMYGPGHIEFLIPSFGDMSKPWIQTRLHNVFTAFNVSIQNCLTSLGMRKVILRNLYPFQEQLPVDIPSRKNESETLPFGGHMFKAINQ